MMMSNFNVLALIFGLIAIALPIVNLEKYRKNWVLHSFISISLVPISLIMTRVFTHYWIRREDWSALMDTSLSILIGYCVLTILTILLNISVYRKNVGTLSKGDRQQNGNIVR